MERIKVAVRVRPVNKREIELGTQNVIHVESNQIVVNLNGLKDSRKSSKIFTYDYCFDSSSTDKPNFATQEIVYNSIGLDIINNAFSGYNSCIFAYGQTGSGKSYTMTGSIDNKGLIPRICEGLCENINKSANLVKIEVSYMEIYNEKVLDLLDPRGVKNNLKVREHKLLGPYVDGLSKLAVTTYKDIEVLINEGNKSRTVAATNMNSESSRSHAVFCLKISQTINDAQSGISGEKVSKLSLVDLAGSEKASKTGVEGDRLKEGCNINRSLHTLGLVISALADNASNNNKTKHIPYRDSVLTWLLKDSLGGNSKTVMIATISPAFDNLEETVMTLRYADRAKRIENHATVNEDPNAKLIRELREEVELLKQQLSKAKANNDIAERLEVTEKIYAEVSKPWDEKLAETEKHKREWSQELEKLGISVQSSGIKVEKDKFYLVNMNADPSMNELLVYYLKDSTIVGKMNPVSGYSPDIQLSGPGIVEQHCIFTIKDNDVYLSPLNENSRTRVNGTLINNETLLHHSDRIVIGLNHYFRINCPNKSTKHDTNEESSLNDDYEDEEIDYAIAQEEVLRNDNNTYFQNAAFDLQNNNRFEGENFKIAINKLQERLIRANTFVREANVLSKEMNKQTQFNVTLQISPSNLKLARNKDCLLFEPAVSVKRLDNNTQQIWSLEKFENRIVDMREMYREIQIKDPLSVNMNNCEENDPFYEALENHKLIGVANLFLNSLLSDCSFEYSLPIINQQGEIAGYLKVEIKKDKHYLNDFFDDMESSNNSQIDLNSDTSETDFQQQQQKKTIKCILTIKEATGLPASLSKFVFCQYKFWNELEERCVGPDADDENFKRNQQSINNKMNFLNGVTIRFNRSEEHIISRNEAFSDYCTDNSLAIEVWGHQNMISENVDNDLFLSKYSSLIESWQQVRKSIKLWADILELDKMGQWIPVNIKQHKRNYTGGVYQLKQGTSKRIKIRIEEKSLYRDLLPLYIQDFSAIEIGCVEQINCSQRNNDSLVLDSYQEEDLNSIREKWLNYLDKRKAYIDSECKVLIDKTDRNSIEIEREKYLYEQLVELAEERNLIYTPPANSHLPGSLLNWQPEQGMEANIPIIFLNSNDSSNEVSSYDSDEMNKISGNNCLLINELPENEYFILPIINKTSSNNSCEAISIWDSTIHEDNSLNLVTPNEQFVYLIIKIKIKIVQPFETEFCIRKRICVQIYDPNSMKINLKKSFGSFFNGVLTNIAGSQTNLNINKDQPVTSTGVTYYIISNLPRFLEDYEQYDNLAIMAAINSNASTNLIDKYLERYMSCIKVVDSLLENDKKRQELALQQAIRNDEQQGSNCKTSMTRLSTSNLNMKQKTTSVPNLLNLKSLSFGSTQNINLKLTQSASAHTNNNNSNKQQTTTPVVIMKTGQEPPKIFGKQQQQQVKRGNNLINKFDKLSKPPPAQQIPSIIKQIDNKPQEFEESIYITNVEHDNGDKLNELIEQVKAPVLVNEEQKPILMQEEPISVQKEPVSVEEVKMTQEPETVIIQNSNHLKPELNDSQMSNSTSETSLLSNDNSERDKLPDWVKENAHVIVKTTTVQNQPGFIRFIGETKFSKGMWVGVELERTRGLNDGSCKGHRYFQCDPEKGVFVRADKLTLFKQQIN